MYTFYCAITINMFENSQQNVLLKCAHNEENTFFSLNNLYFQLRLSVINPFTVLMIVIEA